MGTYITHKRDLCGIARESIFMEINKMLRWFEIPKVVN